MKVNFNPCKMPDLKNPIACKILAIALSVFLVFQVHYLGSQGIDPVESFKAAKQQYRNGDYLGAQTTLERITRAVDTSKPEYELFLGYVYLLLGASNESTRNSEGAVLNYTKAKRTLGDLQPVIEGISFTGLAIYAQILGTQTSQPIQKPVQRSVQRPIQRPIQSQGFDLLFQFRTAKAAYFSGDYYVAKSTLERLLGLASIEGDIALKGETYLLLGATYEKLNDEYLAVKFYCSAKDILGEGRTTEGLELNSLRYYRQSCKKTRATVAYREGTRRGRRGFVKALGIFLGVTLLGTLIWYLFFSSNSPFGKKGNYTSITAKIEVTYKGLNSKGRRKLTFDNKVKLNETFNFPQAADSIDCANASKEYGPYTYTITTTDGSIDVKQEFLNWDYYNYSITSTNRKSLCASWDITIESYEYEGGKDPGGPTPTGHEQLENLSASEHCQAVTNRVHNCEINATIQFNASGSKSNVKKVYTVTTSKLEASTGK